MLEFCFVFLRNWFKAEVSEITAHVVFGQSKIMKKILNEWFGEHSEFAGGHGGSQTGLLAGEGWRLDPGGWGPQGTWEDSKERLPGGPGPRPMGGLDAGRRSLGSRFRVRLSNPVNPVWSWRHPTRPRPSAIPPVRCRHRAGLRCREQGCTEAGAKMYFPLQCLLTS